MSLLKSHAFKFNPFSKLDASQDPHLPGYFVDQGFVDTLIHDESNCTIIWAPRGGGKTAGRIMFERRLPADQMAIVYDRFPFALDNKRYAIPVEEHLVQLIRLLVLRILLHIHEKPDAAAELTDLDKYTIGYLAYKVLTDLDRGELVETVRSITGIEVHAKRFADWFEQGGAKFVQKLMSGILGMLRTDCGQVVTVENVNHFEKELTNGGYNIWSPTERAVIVNYFEALTRTLPRLGITRANVLVDNVDELPQTAADPKAAFTFVRALLTNLFLYKLPGLSFRYFLWDRVDPQCTLEEGVRRDRITDRHLRWRPEQLDKMLSERMRTASKLSSFDGLVAKSVRFSVHKLIVHVAAGCPRDMVRLADRIINEHDAQRNGQLISEETVWSAVRKYCMERARELLSKEEHQLIAALNRRAFNAAYLQTTWGNGIDVAATLQKFRDTGVIALIEQENHHGHVQELYSYGDLRVAIGTNINEDPKNILRNAYICSACGRPLITNRNRVICEPDNRTFFATASLKTVWHAIQARQ